MTSSNKTKALVTLGLLALVMAVPASADAIYTYTGNQFTTASDDCCGIPEAVIPGFISGSFTLTGPLAANLAPDTDISSMLLSFNFTANNGNPEGPGTAGVTLLKVGTDASGNIISWKVQFYEDFGYNLNYLTTYNDPISGVFDNYNIAGGAGYNETVSNDAGTWVGPVPEPGTLAMFGPGLLGVAGLLGRKLKV